MTNYKLDQKKGFEGLNVSIDTKRNNGYKVTPKNKVKYGVAVNEMFIINPSLIEKLLRKKIGIKLDNYLQYIITVLDDSESDADAGKISTVLSDLNRYQEIVQNNYKQYLNEKYIELLLKKIELLEYELKRKLMQLNAYNYSKLQSLYDNGIVEERKKSR